MHLTQHDIEEIERHNHRIAGWMDTIKKPQRQMYIPRWHQMYYLHDTTTRLPTISSGIRHR